MAEENASPISAAKPPVSNPMSSATSVHASTLKLKPVIRKSPPGGTVAGSLKPGVKLPTQTALRPGVRLPTKPVIRKPGMPTATKLPVAPRPSPTAAPATPAPAASAAEVPSAAVSSAMDALKGATQKLKGITQQIPAQAILHKTGIIADQEMTEAQKLASKSRTARISLSDAIGVAPVKSETMPMKTIRIKRPVDLGNPTAASKPVVPAATPAVQQEPAEKLPPVGQEAAAAPAKAPDATSVTQRKTLKISRPGAGVRPTSKFGVKKPGSAPVAKPAEATPAGGEVADLPPVGDIPDLPEVQASPKTMYTNVPASSLPPGRIPDVSKTCNIFSLLVQLAACALVAFLGYELFQETQRPLRCGGTLPDEAQMSTPAYQQIQRPLKTAEEPLDWQ